jgi:tetratricopeptide (TPR) repeat protein
MLNDGMIGTVARLRLGGMHIEHVLRHSLAATAKEAGKKLLPHQELSSQRLKPDSEQRSYRSAEALRHPKTTATSSFSVACKDNPQAEAVIAALKRYATQNLVVFTIVIAASLWLSCMPAQSQTPTQAQTGKQLLEELDSGQLRDAVLLGQQAVSRWPRHAQFRHYLGVAYFKTGDSKQAKEQLTHARELDPNDSAIHFDLALVLLSQQDYSEAADELQAATKLSPSNALAHMLLGRAYLNSNRSLQAIEEFKTTLKLDPAMKLGHYHLGFAYFSLGRNDEAIGEYKEELRRSRESPAVVYELGRSLLESGKYEAALTYLQRGTQLDAPNPDVWYNLGKAQALAGQWAQAEPSLRRAAELNPKDPSPHYQLARVLEKLGKNDEARSERERFAELKKAQPASAGMATGRDQ